MEWLRPASSMNHAKRTFCVCHMSEPTRGRSSVVSGPEAPWGMVRPFTTRDLSTRRRPCVCVPMTSSRPIATDRVRAIDRSGRVLDRAIDRSISIDRASLADAAHSIRAHGDDACGACGATGRTHEAGGDVATGEHRVASGCRRHKPSERRQKPSEFIHSFIH